MARETFTLGGRSFTRVKETTIGHDLYLTARVRAAGLQKATIAVGEDADSFVRRLMFQAAESSAVLEILGALVVPEDTERWSPELAGETAAFIGQLSSEDDKSTIQYLLAETLAGFFERGITSLYELRRASGSEASADPDPEKRAVRDGEGGPDSSEPSLGTTTSEPLS